MMCYLKWVKNKIERRKKQFKNKSHLNKNKIQLLFQKKTHKTKNNWKYYNKKSSSYWLNKCKSNNKLI